MEKEIKAVREMVKKVPNIIGDIEKISWEYEASTGIIVDILSEKRS